MKIIQMYDFFPFNNLRVYFDNYLNSLLLNKLSNFIGSLSDNNALFRDLKEILK
jgi:hypothetical protein